MNQDKHEHCENCAIYQDSYLRERKARQAAEEITENKTRSLYLANNELQSKNDALVKTMDEIKQLQGQLINSEKMAVLGQLVAGVSHEINTPAGTILNAIEEIDRDYALILQKLVHIIEELPDDLRNNYVEFCKVTVTHLSKKERSTIEERQIAREIQQRLSEEGIDNARSISKNFALIGLQLEHLEPSFIKLLKSPMSEEIQNSLFQLGMSQVHVRDIKIAINRITSIVKALKLYSHMDQDEIIATCLTEDIDNTLIILNNKLKRGIKIIKEYDEIPLIRCNADKLNQVWTNLINNAVEAMQGEGIIIIRIRQEEKKIVIEIEDNGPGIPPETLPHIFDYYFTTKKKGEGTGLGLSISKDIVEKQYGEFTVNSMPGKTVFRVKLPLT